MDESLKDQVVRREFHRRDALRLLMGGGLALVAGPTVLAACSSESAAKPSSSAAATMSTSLPDTSAAAPGSTASAAPASTTTIASLTWGNGSFDGLDSASAASNFASTATAPALEALIGFSSDLKIEPILATSYKKPDNLHYVYQIRSGVKFWDGTALTADDVAYSMNRHLDPKVASQLATYFANVKAITITGANEVTVQMATPDPQFEYVPALVPIFPKAFVTKAAAKFGTPAGATLTIMGTGPMKITNYDDTGVSYEAWTGYWGTKSLVQKLKLVSFTSADASRLAFQSGSVDGTFYGITGDTLKSWQGITNSHLQSSSAINVGYLALNTTMAPFDDVHVRRALAYATDTAGFLKAFLGQAGEAPTSIVPPAYFANLADQTAIDTIYQAIPQYPFDLTKAKAELAQSKYPNGFTVEVPYTPQFPISGEVLVSMSETLKQIGVTFTPKSMTIGAWAKLHQANASPILWGYWLPDYPDPSDIESLFFPSAGAVPHRNNKAHWKVPAVDALLSQQAATTDPAVRVQALGKILEMAGDEMPYLPLWWERAVMAVDSSKFTYTGFSPLFYVNNWVPDVSAAK